jgi:uncharacterized protein DUF4154
MCRRVKFLVRLLCCCLATGCAAVRAQQVAVPEYALKAAYIYHFIQFTDWPEAKLRELNAFTLCIAADNPLTTALMAMGDRAAHKKPIVIRTLPSRAYSDCQIVVLGAAQNDGAEVISAQVPAFILTIADDPNQTRDNVIIALLVEEGRAAFSINLTRAHADGLEISSKLLRLARSVR